ncbi:MAG TPA: SCO2525 family SAM-dependent methyltransferase [Actinoplanes sp.]|nr:SCO2525 family SAM-dependent methyltransferase [Actinoplanes sp.]
MTNPDVEVSLVRNSDVDWDVFDSDAYFKHNYGRLRPDDAQIIQIVADYFQETLRGRPLGKAIDVGAGANLYPAMMMLPYAAEVTLFERAFSNYQWLTTEIKQPRPSWGQFWTAISQGRAGYERIQKPSEVLQDRATVHRGSVFDLRPGLHDLGTMFFVAESITTRTDEFRRATGLFVNTLRPGAPFAAAFMRDSSGYFVAGRHFPACSVNETDVQRALAPFARNLNIVMVESNDLRDGYGGMMVATGRKK